MDLPAVKKHTPQIQSKIKNAIVVYASELRAEQSNAFIFFCCYFSNKILESYSNSTLPLIQIPSQIGFTRNLLRLPCFTSTFLFYLFFIYAEVKANFYLSLYPPFFLYWRYFFAEFGSELRLWTENLLCINVFRLFVALYRWFCDVGTFVKFPSYTNETLIDYPKKERRWVRGIRWPI